MTGMYVGIPYRTIGPKRLLNKYYTTTLHTHPTHQPISHPPSPISHSLILPTFRYLNYGGDWTTYYTDDPMSYLPSNASAKEKGLVIGGEACMWSSAFDAASNMDPAMW